jgi:hypothetical protein
LLFVLYCFVANATNFYVSNTGNDANPGTLASPWATTSKVNSSMGSFVAGDSILFQRGNEFFGTLTVNKAGVIVGAYGTGNLPIITGFKTLSGWTNTGTNLWTSASSASPKSYMKVVTINGVMSRMGRYPDYADNASAWLTYTNALPSSSPVTVNFSSTMPFNFVGGELVLRKESYVLDIMPILSQAANSFSCTNPAWPGKGNYGFFVQNDLDAVTTTNEWYFNPSTKALTIYNTASPTATIRGAVFDTLVNVSAANVTIENLDIQGSNRFGVFSNGGSLVLKNNTVRFIGHFGVRPGGSSSVVLNNLIRDIGSTGIYITNSGTIQGNQVRAVNLIDGMGASLNDECYGIALEGNSITVRNNIVDSIGYSNIKIGGSTNGNNILIRENVVSNTCMNKNDGGAIYSYGAGGAWTLTNRVIKRNILINNGKILYGMPSEMSTAYYPMYMDGAAPNVIIDSNVIAFDNVSQNSVNVNGIWDNYGILMNNPQTTTLTNNITFAVPTAFSVNVWPLSYGPKPVGNSFTNNCFYVNTTPGGSNYKETNKSFFWHAQQSMSLAQVQLDVQNVGVMNNNFYNNNTLAPFHWTTYSANGPFPTKLAGWQSFSGKDAASVSTPNITPEFQYNATASPITYPFSGRQKKDFKGNIYNNQATIPPYYANIFFDNGPATGTTLAAFSTASQINCAGGTATVTVTATGGVPPYSGTGNFTVTAGTYTYTVTDAATPTPNSITTSITVTQPPVLSVNSSKTNVLCNGGSTGTITVVASGGTPNYTYNWGGGVTTQNRTALPIGTYTCTITDSKGCTTTTSQTINQPTALSAGTPTAPAILVNGGTTTITQPVPTGATSPYQYQLNTGAFQTSNVFNNVSAGNYTINIKDANNCTIARTISITQPTVITSTVASTNVTCNGASSGSITLTVNGGTPGYTFLWNGGQTTQNRTAIPAGTYTVTVTDANACTLNRSVTITEPTALSVTSSVNPTNILCNGGTSSVTIGASGGTSPYTGLGTFPQSAGTVTYIVTDANGCPASRPITLTQPAVLTASNPTSGTITVNGGNTTITQPVPTGGVSPYTYSLNTGAFQSSNVFTGVAAGTYTVNIKDANGCTITKSISITQPAVFSASAVQTGPTINCNGQNTIVTVSATGGTAPYTGTGTFTVPAGPYNYTVTDALGNTASASITISQPTEVVASIAAGSITSVGGTTNIVVSATGGVLPYTGTGTFTRGAGLYSFTVTDSNGCSSVATVSINDPVVIPNQYLILNSVFKNGN